jgi:hypothetical protein
MSSTDKFELYDKALKVMTDLSSGIPVNEAQRAHVKAFLDATPQEDEWLARKSFINGSPALLMRSMVNENGSENEKWALEGLADVRVALRSFVDEGKRLTIGQRTVAEVSIKWWKKVEEWHDRMLPDSLFTNEEAQQLTNAVAEAEQRMRRWPEKIFLLYQQDQHKPPRVIGYVTDKVQAGAICKKRAEEMSAGKKNYVVHHLLAESKEEYGGYGAYYAVHAIGESDVANYANFYYKEVAEYKK